MAQSLCPFSLQHIYCAIEAHYTVLSDTVCATDGTGFVLCTKHCLCYVPLCLSFVPRCAVFVPHGTKNPDPGRPRDPGLPAGAPFTFSTERCGEMVLEIAEYKLSDYAAQMLYVSSSFGWRTGTLQDAQLAHETVARFPIPEILALARTQTDDRGTLLTKPDTSCYSTTHASTLYILAYCGTPGTTAHTRMPSNSTASSSSKMASHHLLC